MERDNRLAELTIKTRDGRTFAIAVPDDDRAEVADWSIDYNIVERDLDDLDPAEQRAIVERGYVRSDDLLDGYALEVKTHVCIRDRNLSLGVPIVIAEDVS